MGYKVKWVEDNLGVTRKALRGFEEAGLMPENTGRQYRDYDEDDIDRIWTIRVFQGMGYAKIIKFTGRFPSRPRKMGEMKFDDFQQDALERWNIKDDPQGAEYAKLADTILSKSAEEWEDSDLGRMFSMLESMMQMDNDLLLAEYVLPRAIVKRQRLGANHPDI